MILDARNFTTNRAKELSDQYPKVVANQKYQHFEMHYLGNFMRSNVASWIKQGGNPVDFFEVIDGM